MSGISLKVGDRVRLDPAGAEGWLQPFRKFCIEGRMATVVGVSEGVRRYNPPVGSVFVLFDKGRKSARDIREIFREKDLVMVREGGI